MTNHTSRTVTITVHEVAIPLREGKATRKDVLDLLYFADDKYRDLFEADDPHIQGDRGLYDDAYYIEARDDELVAVIREASQ